MNEMLQNVVNKVKENQALTIKVGSALLGAVVGGVIGMILSNTLEEDEGEGWPTEDETNPEE